MSRRQYKPGRYAELRPLLDSPLKKVACRCSYCGPQEKVIVKPTSPRSYEKHLCSHCGSAVRQ